MRQFYPKHMIENQVFRDTYLMLSFGLLAIGLGFINLNIPGLETAESSLLELALIIGVIHLSNPLYGIGLSAMILVHQPSPDSIPSTFLSHFISLTIIWFLFRNLKLKHLKGYLNFGASFLYVSFYYLILMIPLVIFINKLIGINIEKGLIEFYRQLFNGTIYEYVSTALFVSIYFVQYKLREELKLHKKDLEKKVFERTIRLEATIEKLKNTQQSLIQSAKMSSLATLTSGVAHEINNPLNFISGGVQLINDLMPDIQKSVSDDLNRDCAEAINIISEGVDRSSYIVNALMSFSGSLESKREFKDVNSIIDNTLLFMSQDVPTNIIIDKEYRLEDDVPVFAEKMHQVFFNIIINAFFELKKERVEEKLITIKTDKVGNKAEIQIVNNGPAILPEHIEQIFDPFFTTKNPDEGYGLGMSIAYNYIDEHNGNILVLNTEKGVCFKIILPLKN